jgi:hypothetical protein
MKFSWCAFGNYYKKYEVLGVCRWRKIGGIMVIILIMVGWYIADFVMAVKVYVDIFIKKR